MTKEAQRVGRRRSPWVTTCVLVGVLLLIAWVQRHALRAFFSSPDDLIHLQQAAGLLPSLPTPFRVLSQVVYLRMMLELVGANPVPYHAATMLTHLVIVGLVFLFASRVGAGLAVAALAATLFGAFPLNYILLSSAVGMNDELALMFALGGLCVLSVPTRAGAVKGGLLFAVAMVCKESVITLPLLAFAIPQRSKASIPVRRIIGVLAICALFGVVFFVLRLQGLAPGGEVYSMRPGANVFHNLMTYAAWAGNLWNPIPDLVSSYDPQAWKVGLWVMLGVVAAWLVLYKRDPAIRVGGVWWALGILPVLGLQYQTYRHYMYPALPGIALVFAGTLVSVVCWLGAIIIRPQSGQKGALSRATWIVVAVVILAYGIQSESLIRQRIAARVVRVDLPLDPVTRRRETAQRAIQSIALAYPDNVPSAIAILIPEGTGRVFGARSGKEYKPSSGNHPYSLLAESLDNGRALRLFYPNVRHVVFIPRWTATVKDYALFLPYLKGELFAAGSGPASHVRAAIWMLRQGWYDQVRVHLAAVRQVYPEDLQIDLLTLPVYRGPAGMRKREGLESRGV